MKRRNSNSKGARRARTLAMETLEVRDLLAVDAFGASALAASAVEPIERACVLLDVDDASRDPAIDLSSAVVDASGDAEEGAEAWYSLANSSFNPSGIEQELLEQINRFRADPQGELDRIFSVCANDEIVARNPLVNSAITLNSYPKNDVSTFLSEWSSLSATSPLALNSALTSAAASHSSFMKMRNEISHVCQGEADFATRLSRAGFASGLTDDDGNALTSENIGGCFSAYGGWSAASHILAAFAVDWGVPSHEHRDALMNAAYTEIGISVVETSKSIGPHVATCDFGSSVEGSRADGAYLLGVIYDDANENLFYDAGEGVANARVLIERLDGSETQSVEISAWNSGGYQIFLTNGSYRATISSAEHSATMTKTFSIDSGTNVKLDFRIGDAGSSAPVVDLNANEEGTGLRVVYREGAEYPLEVLSQTNLSITDADSAYLYSASIRFGARPDGAAETIDVTIAGSSLRASFDEQSGVVTISGAGALEEYADAIASLTYFNETALCDVNAERFLLISVYDGANWSEEAKLTIEIEPTNLPNMTAREMFAYEGDDGATLATFVVELDSPARFDVSFNFNVAVGGAAIEGADFVVSKGDPITIAQGETTAAIECYVNGNYDPLKPEGLAAIEGGFEKAFVDFYLEIVDVKYAKLTNENALVKGTIYDDDSPIALGTTNEYALKTALSTEEGARRYVFTVTPETVGYYSWNADSLGLPENAVVSVRENSLESDPIAVSKVAATGASAQWFADPDVEYWITIESSDDVSSIAARLLELSDEKVALVDPLIESSDEELVDLMWADDGLDLVVGDWAWNFPADFWNGMTFKTTLPDVVFETALPPSSSATLSEVEDGAALDFEDGRGFTVVGFETYAYSGNDDHETLALSGSSGDDYLYYSNGSGWFRASNGKMSVFNRVNTLKIDGGGGNDFAFVEDTPSDDRLETTNGALALYGGGFALEATNFSQSRVIFNKGGDDEYFATDSGDDVIARLSKSASIVTGTYVRASEENEDPQEDGGEAGDAPATTYSRVVMGADRTTIAPLDTIASLVLESDFSTSAVFKAEVGALTAFDLSVNRGASVSRAQTISVLGLNATAENRLAVQLPATYETYVEGQTRVVVDSATGWSLRVPTWKSLAPDPSSESSSSSASRDAAFDSAVFEEEDAAFDWAFSDSAILDDADDLFDEFEAFDEFEIDAFFDEPLL